SSTTARLYRPTLGRFVPACRNEGPLYSSARSILARGFDFVKQMDLECSRCNTRHTRAPSVGHAKPMTHSHGHRQDHRRRFDGRGRQRPPGTGHAQSWRTAEQGGSVMNPATDSSPAPFLLEMRSITKTFPGVVALADVNLKVRTGEIHAIV